MNFFTATTSNWFIIGPISKVLGYVMNGIFEVLNAIGIPNIGLAIIIFTFVITALMIPLSIKQQKYSKLQSLMQPEIKLIQDKYKGTNDNASVMAMQTETKEVYAKYGTSPTGGCVQMLIQMPILFALYQVIYHMPGHITRLRGYYEGIVEKLQPIISALSTEQQTELTTKFASGVRNFDLADNKYLIDMLYKFSHEKWESFFSFFSSSDGSTLRSAYEAVAPNINKANYFLGIDLSMRPTEMITNGIWWAVFIPLLAGGLQWLSSKMMQGPNSGNSKNDSNSAAGMMNSMNIVFPIMSVVFCFMFEAGLGLYWVASAGVQVLIQLFVNNYMNKVDLNEMVQKNVEKMNEKRIKKGLPPRKVQNVTTMVRNLEDEKKRIEDEKKLNEQKAKESGAFYESRSTAKKGSLAEKAGMVQQYEERQKELKAKGPKNM